MRCFIFVFHFNYRGNYFLTPAVENTLKDNKTVFSLQRSGQMFCRGGYNNASLGQHLDLWCLKMFQVHLSNYTYYMTDIIIKNEVLCVCGVCVCVCVRVVRACVLFSKFFHAIGSLYIHTYWINRVICEIQLPKIIVNEYIFVVFKSHILLFLNKLIYPKSFQTYL